MCGFWENFVVKEVLIDGKKESNEDERLSIFNHFGIQGKECNEENNHQRVHTNALIPTHDTRRKHHYFTEKKATECGNSCGKPTEKKDVPSEV